MSITSGSTFSQVSGISHYLPKAKKAKARRILDFTKSKSNDLEMKEESDADSELSGEREEFDSDISDGGSSGGGSQDVTLVDFMAETGSFAVHTESMSSKVSGSTNIASAALSTDAFVN